MKSLRGKWYWKVWFFFFFKLQVGQQGQQELPNVDQPLYWCLFFFSALDPEILAWWILNFLYRDFAFLLALSEEPLEVYRCFGRESYRRRGI